MNVIATAFAFREAYGNSMQLTQKSDAEKINLYMKNIVVSLVSAKKQNPKDEVMLVTNREIAEPYHTQLLSNGVKISLLAFDRYEMPKRYAWALAFYKLCALEYLSGLEAYDKILLVDNDTVTMGGLQELWQEAEYGLLLYPVGHSFLHQERNLIRQDYQKLYPEKDRNIVHYGGEFICGKKEKLQEFMKICSTVYERIRERDYPVAENIGDETILAIAAAIYKENHTIYEAGAYINRFWTVKRFYLVSTNTVCNPVAIWHLPAEKDRGFVQMYDYFCKTGAFPKKEKACAMFGLLPAKRPFTFYVVKSNLLQKKSRKQ